MALLPQRHFFFDFFYSIQPDRVLTFFLTKKSPAMGRALEHVTLLATRVVGIISLKIGHRILIEGMRCEFF